MKVNDKSNELQLQRLNDQVKRKIVSKEQELENIKDYYKIKVQDTKNEGSQKILSKRDSNQIQLEQIAQNFQEKVETYNENLNETEKRLESEKSKLVGKNQNELKDINNSHKIDIKQKHDEMNDYARNFDFKAQQDMEKQNHFAQRAVEKNRLNSKRLMDKNATSFDKIIKSREKDHKLFLKKNSDQNKTIQTQAMSEYYSNINQMKDQNQRKIKEQESGHKTAFENNQKVFQLLMQQKTDNFKKKYTDLIKNQQVVLKRLQNLFKSEINDLNTKHSKFKNNQIMKSNDNFYSLTKLRPYITEHSDSYDVSVKIPDYEKENFNITTDKRDIKLTLTRRYNNQNIDQQGNINKSKRSEVMTKIFKVDDIIDSNKVLQKYENGVLTFRILKS